MVPPIFGLDDRSFIAILTKPKTRLLSRDSYPARNKRRIVSTGSNYELNEGYLIRAVTY